MITITPSDFNEAYKYSFSRLNTITAFPRTQIFSFNENKISYSASKVGSHDYGNKVLVIDSV